MSPGMKEESLPIWTLSGGVTIQQQLSTHWFLSADVLFQRKGFRIEIDIISNNDDYGSFLFNYFSLPVTDLKICINFIPGIKPFNVIVIFAQQDIFVNVYQGYDRSYEFREYIIPKKSFCAHPSNSPILGIPGHRTAALSREFGITIK